MELFTAGEVARAVSGYLARGDASVSLGGVAVDSRSVRPGDLFVALKGENTDGHLFLQQAREAGARACLVARVDTGAEREALPEAAIVVEDPLRALGDLARWHLDKIAPLVVGVTGSVGKTTTKEMIASVLGQRWGVLKNPGNYNTEVGLPLSLFSLRSHHQVAVLEMSMRGSGEIRRLTEIAPPKVGVLTTVRETHMELLGNIERIAAAKGELIEALPHDGFAVLNADEPLAVQQEARTPAQKVFYGLEAGEPAPQVRADNLGMDGSGSSFRLILPSGCIQVRLPLPGRHHVSNALAAAAVGMVLGLVDEEIKVGLETFAPPPMRMEIKKLGTVTVINDAYNASPTSTRAALEVLRQLAGAGRAVAILGDMLELGPYAEEGHRQVGAAIKRLSIDLALTSGKQSRWIHEEIGSPPGCHFENKQDLIAALQGLIRDGDTVLVKGSRGMKMEEIVTALQYLEEKAP